LDGNHDAKDKKVMHGVIKVLIIHSHYFWSESLSLAKNKKDPIGEKPDFAQLEDFCEFLLLCVYMTLSWIS